MKRKSRHRRKEGRQEHKKKTLTAIEHEERESSSHKRRTQRALGKEDTKSSTCSAFINSAEYVTRMNTQPSQAKPDGTARILRGSLSCWFVHVPRARSLSSKHCQRTTPLSSPSLSLSRAKLRAYLQNTAQYDPNAVM